MKSLIHPVALFIYSSESSVDTRSHSVAGMRKERPWRSPWRVFMVWVYRCAHRSLQHVRHMPYLLFGKLERYCPGSKDQWLREQRDGLCHKHLEFKSIIFGIRLELNAESRH